MFGNHSSGLDQTVGSEQLRTARFEVFGFHIVGIDMLEVSQPQLFPCGVQIACHILIVLSIRPSYQTGPDRCVSIRPSYQTGPDRTDRPIIQSLAGV